MLHQAMSKKTEELQRQVCMSIVRMGAFCLDCVVSLTVRVDDAHANLPDASLSENWPLLLLGARGIPRM